jgi:hypothetical protein
MAGLTSTESIIVDLVALRNWHFKAWMDKNRSPEMRRWHRSQVKAISRKLSALPQHTRDVIKIALIEVMADKYREQLHKQAGRLAPFAWEKFCEAARKQLTKAALHLPSNFQQ